MKRKIYQKLLDWKVKSQGSTALLLDGARRVGKSYIAETFGRTEYKSFLLVDFGRAAQEVRDLFLHDSADFELFFAKLSAYYGTRLYLRESLIIFDEVQQFPFARQLIKYLVLDGRYDYLETGSLIRLKKNVADIVIPSEEEHLEMFPMDFEEFLWALGDEATMPLLRTCFDKLKPLGQSLHRKVMNDFRRYMLVGGMPQAVDAYVKTNDFGAADRVKRRILALYREDVAKFAEGYEERVFALFDAIPGQLSKKEKKFQLSAIDKSARQRSYEDSFLWLNEAMIVNTCFRATDPSVGLALNLDSAAQKCYMADTGLLVTQTFLDRDFTDNELYKAVLFDRLGVNEGMLAENIVAQMLRASGHRLFFFSQSDHDNRANDMEIDFLIKEEKKIVPIEVKSGNYRVHSSLDKFRRKYTSRLGRAVILYGNDVMEKEGVLHLPLYMTPLL